MDMNAISQADRLVLLLRERLAKRAGSGVRATPRNAGAPPATSAQTVKALAAVEGVDDHQLRKALIQNLLADSFGKTLVLDARFQQVVERVVQTIEADPQGASLLQQLVAELKTDAAP